MKVREVYNITIDRPSQNGVSFNTLKSVTIGANVKTIGSNAFFGSGKLKAIIFKGTTALKIGKNAYKKIAAKTKVTVPKKMSKKQLKKLKMSMKSAGKKVVYMRK